MQGKQAIQRDAVWHIDDDCVYLNVSGQAPRLTVVHDAGLAALMRGRSPWRITTEAWLAAVERVRGLAANEFACAAHSISLLPSVAQAMAVAAANLPLHRGDSVLTLSDDHPSAVDVWIQRAHDTGAALLAVSRKQDSNRTEAVLAALDPSVRVVVLPTGHWHDGERLDLLAIAEATKRLGAALVVDASQTLGVDPLNLARVDADFVVCAGYKYLLGAPGIAYLYRAPRHAPARPIEWHGWDRTAGALKARQIDSASVYSQPALAMAEAALAWLAACDRSDLRHTLRHWQDTLCARIRELALPFTLFADSAHITALRPIDARLNAALLVNRLAHRHIHVAARGSGIRVSHHGHNTDADIEHLALALHDITRSP